MRQMRVERGRWQELRCCVISGGLGLGLIGSVLWIVCE